MKAIALTLFVAVTTALSAGVAEDVAYNDAIRARGSKLLAEGRSTEAVAYLSGILRPTQGTDLRVELAQQLATIAFAFHNARNYTLAVSTAREAVTVASPLIAASSRDGYRADLFTNLGILAEVVLHDPASAKGWYGGALVAQPTNAHAKSAIAGIDAKLSHGSSPKN